MPCLVKERKRGLFVLVALVLVVCVQSIGFASGPRKIYWSEWKSIRRANLDGSDVEDVILDLSFPQAITLDYQNSNLFWIEEDVAEFKNVTLGYIKIMRADADGGNIEEVIGGYTIPLAGGGIFGECVRGVCKTWIKPEGQDAVEIDPEQLFHPLSLAIDNKEHIYWHDQRNDFFQQMDLDGKDVTDILDDDRTGRVYDIELDLKREKLYWVQSTNSAIKRMNLDGSQVEDVIFRWDSHISSFDLDVEAGKIYWASSSRGIIYRASLRGDNIEEVVTGLKEPYNIIVDAPSDKIYWNSWDRREDLHSIQRSNLDGSDVTDLVVDTRVINSLALDTEGIFDVELAGKLATVWGDVKAEK